MTEWSSNLVAGEGGADNPTLGHQGTIEFQDVALVERSRKGDMQAFGLLVAKYQDRIFNLILRLCGNPSDAEELAQETFLKALSSIAQFRSQSRFYTWLFRIAANLAISHRRRGGRIRFHSIDAPQDDDKAFGALPQLADARDPGPAAQAAAAEAQHRALAALEEMDEQFRLVVVLRDIEDMDYSQISEVLDLPLGTIKSRLHRARLILKEKLTGLMD